MNDLWTGLREFIGTERANDLLHAAITLAVGLLIAGLIRTSLRRSLVRRMQPHEAMIISRITFYVLVMLVVASTLHHLGFKLSVVLGAAGVLTVALGFAAQTSVSNLISGLFLMVERPFVVGDIIRLEDLTGVVLSIDLMSTKLRTFDNLFVRVPNESLIKSRITNLTHFPIRRLDLQIGVAYKEDIAVVREVLFEVADRNPLSLDEPEPLLIFNGFGDSALLFQFSLWVKRENFLELKNTIQEEIKLAFDARDIEIPFPHLTLYTGSVTEPMPIRLVGDEQAGTPR